MVVMGCTAKRLCSTSSLSSMTAMSRRSRKALVHPAAWDTSRSQLRSPHTPPRSTCEARRGLGWSQVHVRQVAQFLACMDL